MDTSRLFEIVTLLFPSLADVLVKFSHIFRNMRYNTLSSSILQKLVIDLTIFLISLASVDIQHRASEFLSLKSGASIIGRACDYLESCALYIILLQK